MSEESILERLENVIEEPKEEIKEEVKEEPGQDAPDLEGAEEGSESLDIDTLANYIGFDPEKLDVNEDGQLMFKTIVDGEEGRAKLEDLLTSYQLKGHLNKQNMEVVELKKSLQKQASEFEAQRNERLQQLEDLSQIAMSELKREFQEVNWKDLRDEDPAEYAAKMQEMQAREKQIIDVYTKAQQERNEKAAQASQEAGQKLLQSIPEWSDTEVRQKDLTKMNDYALKLGYDAQELNQLSDHRVFVLMRKAMMFDNLQSTKPAINKKVSKAPKLVRPGQPIQKSANADLEKLKSVIKGSGGQKGVAEYLLQSGKV